MFHYIKLLNINKVFFQIMTKKYQIKEKKLRSNLNYAFTTLNSNFSLSATVTINSLFVGFALS